MCCPGQTRPVRCVKFVLAGTMEEHQLAVQFGKNDDLARFFPVAAAAVEEEDG